MRLILRTANLMGALKRLQWLGMSPQLIHLKKEIPASRSLFGQEVLARTEMEEVVTVEIDGLETHYWEVGGLQPSKNELLMKSGLDRISGMVTGVLDGERGRLDDRQWRVILDDIQRIALESLGSKLPPTFKASDVEETGHEHTWKSSMSTTSDTFYRVCTECGYKELDPEVPQ